MPCDEFDHYGDALDNDWDAEDIAPVQTEFAMNINSSCHKKHLIKKTEERGYEYYCSECGARQGSPI